MATFPIFATAVQVYRVGLCEVRNVGKAERIAGFNIKMEYTFERGSLSILEAAATVTVVTWLDRWLS